MLRHLYNLGSLETWREKKFHHLSKKGYKDFMWFNMKVHYLSNLEKFKPPHVQNRLHSNTERRKSIKARLFLLLSTNCSKLASSKHGKKKSSTTFPRWTIVKHRSSSTTCQSQDPFKDGERQSSTTFPSKDTQIADGFVQRSNLTCPT